MSKPQHPYPEHVVEAVQAQMEWAGADAKTALQALWDASRVDDLPQVEMLPDDAVVQAADGLTEFARTMKYIYSDSAYPAHVIYWGDSDA